MHHLFEALIALRRGPQPDKPRTMDQEPLDHPCLTDASPAFLDDLPRPAFAIGRNGAVTVLAEA